MPQALIFISILLVLIVAYFIIAYKLGWGQTEASAPKPLKYHQPPVKPARLIAPVPAQTIPVLVHDGDPRRTGIIPQIVSVRTIDHDRDIPVFGFKTLPVFRGIVLGEVKGLKTVHAQTEILFVLPEGGPYPLLVTEEYIRERPRLRNSTPCRGCGMTELFDPPSKHISRFALADDAPMQKAIFTAHCGFCGNGLVAILMSKPAPTKRT